MNKKEYTEKLAERLYNGGDSIYVDVTGIISVEKRKNARFPITANYVTGAIWNGEYTMVFTKNRTTDISWKANIGRNQLEEIERNINTKSVIFCLFSKTDYGKIEVETMKKAGDKHVYEAAKTGVRDGTCDIYTKDDFESDFNNGHDFSDWYIVTLTVGTKETYQWKK